MAFEVNSNEDTNNNPIGFDYLNSYIIDDCYINDVINFQNQQFPEELHVNLLAFINAYVQEKPADVVDYAIKHFTDIQEKRKKRTKPKSSH